MFRNVQNVLQVISGLYSAEFLLSTLRGDDGDGDGDGDD